MATVLLTCDFDAESPWVSGDGSPSQDLTQRSWGAYGARRGIWRILELLDRQQLPATFFVPGWTAATHPDVVRALASAGHEIGHHGNAHVPPVNLSEEAQRSDVVRGAEILADTAGQQPAGYRSPSWQLTPVVLHTLCELGMAYDSSCMGDDYPYIEEHGDDQILELPVQWHLDDFPHLGWLSHHAGTLRHPTEMLRVWREEVDIAITENRSIVLTFHPEMLGRASPLRAFDSFLTDLQTNSDVTFSTCADFASSLRMEDFDAGHR